MRPVLPILQLTGNAQQRGLAHGRWAAEAIHHNWAVYLRCFHAEGGLNEREVLRRAALWQRRMQLAHPEYARTMAGIASASGLPELAIVALNVRYEILYSAFAQQGRKAGECTAAAVLPGRSSSGRTLLAQNWDWIPEVELIWIRHIKGDHEVLSVTEAGVVGGKLGINSAGLALGVNGLVSHLDRWDGPGTPFHVRCFLALEAESWEEAIAALQDGQSPCSAAFLLADCQAAVAVERAPSAAAQLTPGEGLLVHANHFLAATQLGISQPLGDERRSTYHRWRRVQALLSTKSQLDEEDLKESLRDHNGYPISVCLHPMPEADPAQRYVTVLSVLLDPGGGRLLYASGPPCRAVYSCLRIGD